MKTLTPEDDFYLQEVLKRCPGFTYEAACAYRATRDTSHLATVVTGIIERYVADDLRYRLRESNDDLLLGEHLGIDSLSLTEMSIFVEDVLQISIDDEELKKLRTIGDVKRSIQEKGAAVAL